MPPRSSSSRTSATVPGWLLALVPVMFTYSGWNAAAYVAEEVRDPGTERAARARRSGPLAVIVIYVALNALYLLRAADCRARRPRSAAGCIDVVAERLFGFAVGNLLAVFTIVSLSASISAMTLAGPRVYYAMARDGMFFRGAAAVHPRFRTPAIAIVGAGRSGARCSCLCGSMSQLVSYTGFAVVLFAGIAVASLFVLRRRDPTRRGRSGAGDIRGRRACSSSPARDGGERNHAQRAAGARRPRHHRARHPRLLPLRAAAIVVASRVQRKRPCDVRRRVWMLEKKRRLSGPWAARPCRSPSRPERSSRRTGPACSPPP